MVAMAEPVWEIHENETEKSQVYGLLRQEEMNQPMKDGLLNQSFTGRNLPLRIQWSSLTAEIPYCVQASEAHIN